MLVTLIHKRLLTVLLIVCSLSIQVNAQADSAIETVKDLRVLRQQAEAANLPVLLMFTTNHCMYCEAIRENYLLPMMRSGKYVGRILFKQLSIDDYSYLRNDKGEIVDGDQFALQLRISVTPTILFIDSEWKELTDRLVGISSFDYFDKELESRIHQASLAFRSGINN